MKKITRLVLISAVFVTSGLTAKVANENYKAVVDNDERIHKAYELAKKPNKAAVLEAIVDAANEESDERLQKAVVLEPEEAKTPKVVRVTTSAGVSPKVSTMDKKPVNKDEEFIEKILPSVNIPDCNISVQELKYETKDIFPEFEEMEEETIVMYGWNYPWVMTWTKGETTTTDAYGRQLPTPVDHSTIIANMEKYSDANGLTTVYSAIGMYIKNICDGVFTYRTSDAKNTSYNRPFTKLFVPAGTKLRTTTYDNSSGVDLPSGSTLIGVSCSEARRNQLIYSISTRLGGTSLTLEGNERAGYYGDDSSSTAEVLDWYFNEWNGGDGAVIFEDE